MNKIALTSFKQRYKEFINKKGGKEIGDLRDFVRRVRLNHLDLVKIIGRNRKTIHDKIDKEFISDKDKFIECVKPYLDSIRRDYIPNYFTKYKIQPNDILDNKILGVKTNKHIFNYIRNKQNFSHIRDGVKNQLENIDYYRENSFLVKPSELNVTISISPYSYIGLASYGCDSYSCFSQTDYKCSNKYNLAVSKNTFVILGHREEEFKNEFDLMGKCIFRAFGWMDQGYVVFSNLYTDGICIPSAKEHIKNLIGEVFKVKSLKPEKLRASIDSGVYGNYDEVVLKLDNDNFDVPRLNTEAGI